MADRTLITWVHMHWSLGWSYSHHVADHALITWLIIPTISSCVVPFFSCPQSFLASGSFPVSRLFESGGQSIGASAAASVSPMNIQGWILLGLTGLIFLLSKGLSRVFSSTTIRKHQFLKCWFFSCISSLWFFKNTFYLPSIASVLSESPMHVSFGLSLSCWRFSTKV